MKSNWNDFRFLLALYEGKSLAAASRMTGVDETTVSRRIMALQKALKSRLLYRRNRTWYFTDMGQKMIDRIKPLGFELENLSILALGLDQKLEGTVRVTAPEGLVNSILLPLLNRFWQAHPAVNVEVIGSSNLLSLQGREADVAIRLVKPTEGVLFCKKAGIIEFALFCSKPYSEKLLPKKNQDFDNLNFIENLNPDLSSAEKSWSHKIKKQTSKRISVNSRQSLLVAIEEGLGFGILPVFLASRNLVRIFPDQNLRENLWIVTHEDLKQSAKIRAMVNFLLEIFEQDQRFHP